MFLAEVRKTNVKVDIYSLVLCVHVCVCNQRNFSYLTDVMWKPTIIVNIGFNWLSLPFFSITMSLERK